MRSIGKEKHRKGTEGLSSGTAQQRLSDDQLGRRMAMKRQSKAQICDGTAQCGKARE